MKKIKPNGQPNQKNLISAQIERNNTNTNLAEIDALNDIEEFYTADELAEFDTADDLAEFDEVEKLFEQTKQNLINHYGENKEGMLNGRKHIVINEYLNSFVNFYEAIRSAAKKFQFNLQKQLPALEAIFNYCEDAEYLDMQTAANSINKKLNSSNIYSVRKFEQNFKALFQDINNELNNHFNKSKVRSILAYNLGVKFLNSDYDYNARKRVVTNYVLRSNK